MSMGKCTGAPALPQCASSSISVLLTKMTTNAQVKCNSLSGHSAAVVMLKANALKIQEVPCTYLAHHGLQDATTTTNATTAVTSISIHVSTEILFFVVVRAFQEHCRYKIALRAQS